MHNKSAVGTGYAHLCEMFLHLSGLRELLDRQLNRTQRLEPCALGNDVFGQIGSDEQNFGLKRQDRLGHSP